MDAGTADNGNLHAFDVAEYQLLATWPFDDVTGSSVPVTSVTCSLTNQHVAASAGQLVKVWDFRLEKLVFSAQAKKILAKTMMSVSDTLREVKVD